MKVINIETDFSNIQNLLDEVTEEGKPMTYKVKYNDKYVVIKNAEYDISIVDYIIVNECKSIFNLNKIENLILFQSLYDINEYTNEVYKNKNDKYKIFYMMDFIDNSCMISDNIEVLQDIDLLIEYIKCALYRGIFRVTDFSPRNILIADNKLYSIDENAIGKQYEIIKQRDINKYIKKNITKKVINNIVKDLLSDYKEKINKISIILDKYDKACLLPLIEYHFRFLLKDIYRDLEPFLKKG